MGRRSRKRGLTAPAPPPVAQHARPRPASPSPRARMAQAPAAPWSPFPLTELVVLFSLALIVAGVLTDGGRRGALLACGFALVSLAGLELAAREHFAGYRSHSTLLAAACAIVVDVPLFLWTALPQLALLVIGGVVMLLVLIWLRRAFRARSGGLGFRA
ncbi:MAG TPA: hypothetical protein VFY32_16535 [Solirubrobacteraceae bacterium]|nr:hypothetical protein [Solirubrobacteraceae bacterium]